MGNKAFRSLLALLILCSTAFAVRVKDISSLGGVRDNQLVGYGLVVGLDGTGDSDSSRILLQSIANMLKRFGINVPYTQITDIDNMAAVMVVANLPPFAKPGTRLDVVVSSIGDAESLAGGTLIMTPLRGPDGVVYAVAQGPISVGGAYKEGMGGGRGGIVPHKTVGRIPGGAIVEREVPMSFYKNGRISILLHQPDFTTAVRVANSINQFFGKDLAKAVDASEVQVRIPDRFKDDVSSFISMVGLIDVEPDVPARVVIDERTGTVVMGENVRISTVAVSHGNLSIVIREKVGEEEVVRERKVFVVKGVTVADIVKALNAVGATPKDLIAILQAIKVAGALHADLIIM